MSFKLHLGDCLEVLTDFPDNSVDSIVTDPPYGLSFMGKKWDYDVPSTEIWAECLRALKPGGHMLAFAGTRTQHRMAVRIEDAGFEIRDMIAWVYGSGFPKSHNLKDEWSGWGTALKPALEPITVARKPLIGTVSANVLAHGTGALNIEGCRVGDEKVLIPEHKGGMGGVTMGASHGGRQGGYNHGPREAKSVVVRWPANLIHDGSEEVTELLGDRARFFYCAKASRKDREDGLEGFGLKPGGSWSSGIGAASGGDVARRNNHPTVKPTDLMRYLCRLVTPPGGLVLDPFMGSGSTGKAALLEGFRFYGIEREAEHYQVASARIKKAEEESAQ